MLLWCSTVVLLTLAHGVFGLPTKPSWSCTGPRGAQLCALHELPSTTPSALAVLLHACDTMPRAWWTLPEARAVARLLLARGAAILVVPSLAAEQREQAGRSGTNTHPKAVCYSHGALLEPNHRDRQRVERAVAAFREHQSMDDSVPTVLVGVGSGGNLASALARRRGPLVVDGVLLLVSDGERDFLTTAHNDVLQAPPPIAWIPMRGDARVAKPVEEHQQTLAKSFPDTATRVWWIERRAVLPGSLCADIFDVKTETSLTASECDDLLDALKDVTADSGEKVLGEDGFLLVDPRRARLTSRLMHKLPQHFRLFQQELQERFEALYGKHGYSSEFVDQAWPWLLRAIQTTRERNRLRESRRDEL